jgi:Concanavalin A-like lectin/glucanases superfamily
MHLKRSKNLPLLAAVGASACGSDTDLIIGVQAEVGVTVSQEAGTCGDGATRHASPFDASSDGDCPNAAICTTLKAALVHRYSFNGVGTVATDSVGTAHGTIINAELHGDGSLELAGGTTDQYVDLPNGIVKSLSNATFEAWVTWSSCGGWERVFDFGDAGGGENVRGYATTTLYLTPKSMDGRDVMFGAFKRADQLAMNETRASSNYPLETDVMVHVVLSIDHVANVMALYHNGAFEGSMAFNDSLSILNDINNWLGRSQYVADRSFTGTFYEFRIYDSALSAAEINASFNSGPDPLFLE